MSTNTERSLSSQSIHLRISLILQYCLFCILPLFAQETGVVSKSIGLDKSQSDSFGPSSEASRLDRNAINRYMEYVKWLSKNVNPLIDIALEKGFFADSIEISNRFQIFKQIFSANSVSKKDIENEIIVQKYLETFYPISYSQVEIQKIYENLVSKISSENIPSIEALDRHLKLRYHLFNPVVIDIANKIRLNKEREVQERINRETEMWQPTELKLSSPSETCISKNVDSNTCLLTVGEFNEKLSYQNILKKNSLDSARLLAAKNILTEKFIANQAELSGFANSDSLNIQLENYNNFIIEQNRFHGLGKPVIDKNSLWKAYSDYYSPLFEKRKIAYYSIIGSSDSNFINSLFSSLRNINNTKYCNNLSGNSFGEIPWQKIQQKNLPKEFYITSDTLRKNQFSNVIKTPYGYFLLRKDSTLNYNEAHFEEVKEQLIYLATRQKWLNIDSIYHEKSLNIYLNDRHLSKSQDTFEICLKFYPPSPYPIPLKNKTLSQPIDSIVVSSHLLPPIIQCELTDAFADSSKLKKRSITINNCFGTWEIRILSRKPGNDVIPFNHVRKHILDSLITDDVTKAFNSHLPTDTVFKKIAIARIFMPYYLGMSGGLEQKLLQDFEKGSNSKNDPSLRIKIKQTIQKYSEERINAIDNWLSQIKIDYNVLFSSVIAESQ